MPVESRDDLVKDLRNLQARLSRANETQADAWDVGQAATRIESDAKRIAELEAALRTVQNAAKTIAACHGTELEHLRQNASFDHRIRAEHESLLARDAAMTEALEAAESRAITAERALAEERERCAIAVRDVVCNGDWPPDDGDELIDNLQAAIRSGKPDGKE